MNGSDQVTIGGIAVSSTSLEYQATKTDAENGYVEIVATTGGYMGSIVAVLQGDNARDDREVTITYYDVDGTTSLGTKTVNAGEAIGEFSYTANIPSGYTDNGWVNSTAAAVTTSTVAAANMSVYPFVTKQEDGKYIIPTANGRQLYNTLKNADKGDVIYLANGTYDMGTACRTEVKSNIAILGESRSGVTIVNHPQQTGIQATSTLRITGDNVYLQHLTLRSDVSYSTSAVSGVGVALEINGDKSVCYDVDLQCNQDTYYSNGSTSQRGYFKDGRIEGTVDYICGGGNMWFENTTLYCNARSNGDCITAPSTNANTTYGYVFNNCTIDGDSSTQAGKYNLGRGWQNSPAATWINTICAISPSTGGYTTMSENLVCRFHEYNTMYEGTAITSHTLSGQKYSASSDDIYLSSIGDYTYENVVMGSDNWDPEAIIASYNDSMTQTITTTTVDDAQNAFGTYCSEFNFTATAGTVYAGKLNEAGTSVILTCLNPQGTEVIPAKEGVVIATVGSGKVTITYTTATASTVSDNDLVGTTTRMKTSEGCMALNSAKGIFQQYTGTYFPAGKAYIPSDSANTAKSIVFADNTATAITEVKAQNDNAAYNLAGQRISNSTKGIVIIAGKKIVNK